MSVYGEWQDAVITSGVTSAAVDLGRDYEWVQIYIPTITSANISFTVAETLTGTYYTLGSGSQVITAGTGGFTTVATIGGFRFIKVISSVSQTAETFRIRGSRR
jgi:hypothetical protein